MSETDKSIYYGDYRVVLNIFKTAYFHIFGELFIDEKLHVMDPADCQSTLGTGFEIFYEISWAGWLIDLIRRLKLQMLCMHFKPASKDRRDPTKQTCDDKDLVEVIPSILLGLYMLFIVLIFVNILIAIFRTVCLISISFLNRSAIGELIFSKRKSNSMTSRHINLLNQVYQTCSEIWMNIQDKSRIFQAIFYWDVISEESYR